MSIIIAWLAIGLVTAIGMLTDVIQDSKTRWSVDDAWMVPLVFVVITLSGPASPLVWWWNVGRMNKEARDD